ncbi:MAG: NBR1-Ig-like domain-containing protein [Chloroflexota bacterium]|nr:NBR1-Ig-like domain-containing protein [Chloroflexota bacterium]
MENPTSDVRPGNRKEPPGLSIAELGLRTRARNVLLGAGISTVGDVLTRLEEGDEALTGLKGFGPKSLADLKERLRERGFALPGDVAPSPEVIEYVLEEEAPEKAVPEEDAPEAVGAVAVEAVPEAQVPREVPSFGQRLGATFAQAREQLSTGAWLYGVIGMLVIVALLLPPVSLLERLGIVGYTTVNAENSTASHPDGLALSVDPKAFTDNLRVRLESVPRLEFLEGSAGAALREAIEVLPGYLQVKSPLYKIQKRGEPSQPVMIDVMVPNESLPWETLDLYTWTGEAWEWVGSDLHTEVAEHEFIRARVPDVPASLVVVQAGQITPTVSASLGSDDGPVTAAAGVLDEVNPTGLFLGTDGGFVGDPDSLLQPDEVGTESPHPYAVLPTLRNWAPGATVNRGLLSDVLTMPEIQESHIAGIVQLCTERGFAGVDVDYRGVAPDERDAYTAFISALADALHSANLRLTVVVEPIFPLPPYGGEGGYDLAALGSVADAVKIPFPEDPAAYVEGGEAQHLLNWATAQVERYKLRMLVSSLSVERDGDKVNYISLEQTLAPFGEAVALDDVSLVEPGSQVKFGLSGTGTILGIMPQEATGTYRIEYRADDGESHTVWLGTAANLAAKLHWAQRYHLGGIAVADMFAPGNTEGIVDVVAAYADQRTATTPPASQEMEVVWTVSREATTVDQQRSPLTEPEYTWMVLATTGTYDVKASVAGFDHGSVAVTVAEPTPVPTPAPTPEVAATMETTPTLEATGEMTSTCLNASFVADVTIPDNTQLNNEKEFVKTWRVRNSGTCAWPEDAVLAFSSGEQMGAPDSIEVGAVEVGEAVEVSVELKSPADPGRYTGVWRMKTAEGLFGTNLSVVIQAGEVAEAPPPAPAPVSGGSFELGGHIRDTGFPYADKMHYAGMNWAKVQVQFGQDASGLVAAAHAQGFKIQLSALGSPGMVTQSGFEQNYANWVAGLAASGADAIEIWNEPNIDREWQIGHISPQAYTNLLCQSYSAIKAANAGTAVISGAPAPTGSFGGICQPNGGNCDDAPWLAGLRDAGAVNCMDYIGAHHNAGATSPSARSGHPANPGSTHHSWFFLPQTELYYNTFGGARKLFYTEMGYASQEGLPTFSDWFSWARGTDNAQQAAWLAEAVQLSVNTGMVRCIIVWNIDFVRYGDDPQDGFAIVRPGGGCPACDSLHALLGTR